MENDSQRVPEALAVGAVEAARLLGLSPRTVATLTAQGVLPSFCVGRRRLYSIERLRAWVESAGGEK